MLGHVGKFGGVGWYNVLIHADKFGGVGSGTMQCRAIKHHVSSRSSRARGRLARVGQTRRCHTLCATHSVPHTLSSNTPKHTNALKHVSATHSVRLRTQIVVVASVESDSHIAVEPTTKETC